MAGTDCIFGGLFHRTAAAGVESQRTRQHGAELFYKKWLCFFGKTLDITTSIFSGVFNVVLGLVFALYVLAQKEKLGGQITKVMQALLPQPRVERLVELSALINRTFTNFVTGQLTEAVIIGGLCFIGMKLFSMPYAPMISVLVGFTALIPVFGAFSARLSARS